MRIFNRFYLSLILITVLAVMPLWSMCNAQEDGVIGGDEFSTEDVMPLVEMTVPNVLLDFDELPEGPTTLGAIQNAFPGTCLSGLTFIPRSGTGIYNFNTGGGRALAPNPDGSGDLFLVDPGGAFGNEVSLIIDLLNPVNQFGFQIGDLDGLFNAKLFF